MNYKSGNAVILWLAGAMLAVSLLFPNGFSSQKPADESAPAAPKETDPDVVAKLVDATPAELARINGVYSALVVVLKRDVGKRVKTTEQWEELAANTLQLAIEHPGTHSGLDEAIEAVFVKTVGTTDVLPNNPDTQAKLIKAAEIIANSAVR